MATIFFSKKSNLHPEVTLDTFLQSDLKRSKADEMIKELNQNRTQNDIDCDVNYHVINTNMTEDEFYS